MSGLLFSWANEICSADNEERALVVALMNDFAYVVQAIGKYSRRTLPYTAQLTIEGAQSPTLRGSRSTTLELKSVYTTRRASRSHSVRCCCVLNQIIPPRRILTPCSQFSGSSSLFTFTSGTSDARKPRRYQRLSSTTTLPSKRMSSRSHPVSRANGLACSVKFSKISPGVPLQIAHSFTIECTSARVWKRRYRSLNCSFVKVRNAVSSGRDGER